MVVLDTNAAMLVALQREGWRKIKAALDESTWIVVPDLFVAEAANALWKEHKFGKLGLEDAERALEYIIEMPDQFVPGKDLFREAFTLSALAQRPAYDMFFLVLARRTSAILVTLDRNLLAFALKHDVKVLS